MTFPQRKTLNYLIQNEAQHTVGFIISQSVKKIAKFWGGGGGGVVFLGGFALFKKNQVNESVIIHKTFCS